MKDAVGKCDAQFFVQNLVGQNFRQLKTSVCTVMVEEKYTQTLLFLL